MWWTPTDKHSYRCPSCGDFGPFIVKGPFPCQNTEPSKDTVLRCAYTEDQGCPFQGTIEHFRVPLVERLLLAIDALPHCMCCLDRGSEPIEPDEDYLCLDCAFYCQHRWDVDDLDFCYVKNRLCLELEEERDAIDKTTP